MSVIEIFKISEQVFKKIMKLFFFLQLNLIFLSSVGCGFVFGKHSCTMKHSFFFPPHYFQVYIPFFVCFAKGLVPQLHPL